MHTGTIRKWSQSARWSVAGGDDLAAQDGAVADRWAGELRRRLPVLVVVHPPLLEVLVELKLLFFGPVPVRRQLPGTGGKDRRQKQGFGWPWLPGPAAGVFQRPGMWHTLVSVIITA